MTRHLLNTLFVLTEDSYLSKDGENVVISKEESEIGRFPLHNLEAILCFSYKGASPSLMGACAERGVNLCFYSPRGRFLAQTSGEAHGNVLLRREQFRIADQESKAAGLACAFLIGKTVNSRRVLERALRDHGMRLDVPTLQDAVEGLRGHTATLSAALSAAADDWFPHPAGPGTACDWLRGVEGNAAALYFGVFDQLILQNKGDFYYRSRSRRPPLDKINACLSLSYSLLARDCAAALTGAGLDPYVGFLHTDRPGRASLALDLMEELRPLFGDRFVLTLINSRALGPQHFQEKESGGVYLTDAGKKIFFTAWQERKKEPITHPFLKEKLPFGLLPHIQALLLSRCLRGELDAYPPYFWK